MKPPRTERIHPYSRVVVRSRASRP
ncbi:hypothetical protein EEB14_40855 [Rhodococcus sp. WS4]|nr:hypothetical protein EEB14_40855 [Rhodococcus sp. WS4]